jgi:hypothetical protein
MEQPSRKKTGALRQHRKSIRRLLIWSAIFLLAAAAVLIVRQFALPHPAPSRPVATTSRPSSKALEAFASDLGVSTAPVHLYSVIPGGVHSKKQLAEVLAHDPVVAGHYANFDLQKLRFVRLRHGRQAYVSFRLGNLIFWTNHKIPLFAGETLLTDGTHYARTRCGNRVSPDPMQPTSPLEPSDVALAAPILHVSPSSYKLPPLSDGALLTPAPVLDGMPLGSSDGSPVFPVVFLPPGGGGGGSSGGTPVGSPPGNVPVSVPEPSAIVLLSCGLVALSMKYLWSLWRS